VTPNATPPPDADPGPTDAELMRRLAAGSREAAGELFRRHHQQVYALCLRMSGDTAEAEDVTQDVFLRVLRHAASFDGRARFSTWLFRTTRNAYLNHRRTMTRERNKHLRLAREPQADPGPDEDASPPPKALARLRAALDSLEPDKREVVVMKRFHGLSYEEIGAVCGCTAGAVRVRFHRALQALRNTYVRLDHVESRFGAGEAT
jgi:RNA polymerase sigma-70 factor, ECF subfamily